jgi:hypothetical protein
MARGRGGDGLQLLSRGQRAKTPSRQQALAICYATLRQAIMDGDGDGDGDARSIGESSLVSP